MKAHDIKRYLNNPALLADLSYEQLEKWLVEYPYCGVLRLLLLKKCAIDEHPAFRQQLQLAAVHLPDRVKLHDFLKSQDHVPGMGWVPSLPQPEGLPEEQDKEFKKKTSELIIPLQRAPRPSKNKRFRLPRLPVFEDKAVLDVLNGNHIELLPLPVRKTEKRIQKQVKDLFNFAPDMEAFFKELARNRSKKTQRESCVSDDLEQESLHENQEIASETLAALLAQQGQREKAIKMYEVLSLKFPEKKPTFADRIASLSVR